MAKHPPTRRQTPRAQEPDPVKCPRCDSSNTKFCYYNNYNKSQPRYFCKACKRHWTKGGTLRNVPVGGVRKNKRAKLSTTTSVGPTLSTPYTNQKPEVGPTSIIYEALIGSSGSLQETVPLTGNETGLQLPENVKTEFQFSNLSNSATAFDVSSLNSSSSLVQNYSSGYGYDHQFGNLDSIEESTITSVNVPTSSPWPETGFWNWNEIDVLTSADHLNIVWDDDDFAEIKP